MTNVQDIKITSRPQLFDINKNFTNFKSKIYAISKKPFYATIISQSQIDDENINTNSLMLNVQTKNKNDDFQFYENISVNTNNKFQQYYLIIKSGEENEEIDSKIVIETIEIPRSEKLVEQDKQQLKQREQVQKEEDKPLLSKIFTLKNILYMVIIICVVLLLYYFFTKSDKKDVKKSPSKNLIEPSVEKSESFALKSEPASVKSEPASVKSEPASVKSEPASAKSESIPSQKNINPISKHANRMSTMRRPESRQQDMSSERNVSFKGSPNSYKYEKLRNFLSAK